MYLASNIKKLRERKGISQKRLSEDLHYSKSTVGRYEIERRTPDLKTAIMIADYFNVTLDTLLLKDLTHGVIVYRDEIQRHEDTLRELKEGIAIKSYFLDECRAQNEAQSKLLHEFADFIEWKLHINPASTIYRDFEAKLQKLGIEVEGRL